MEKKPFLTEAMAQEIIQDVPTPFHVYDEKGIRENARRINKAFSWNKGFKEYFAVKALPNPVILQILQDALSTLGYQTGSRIDGIFGARTEEALKGFQRRTSLRVDGVCGCNSWKKISTAVIGVGRTKTTID